MKLSIDALILRVDLLNEYWIWVAEWYKHPNICKQETLREGKPPFREPLTV